MLMAQAAPHMRGGGAGREAYTFIGLHQFSGRQTDAPLLLGETLLTRQEAAVVAERLVEQRLNQGCAAVRSADQPTAFKPHQVASDAGCRRAGDGENLLNRCAPCAKQKFNDQLRTTIDGRGHIATDSNCLTDKLGNT
jgi:hypothetical protein